MSAHSHASNTPFHFVRSIMFMFSPEAFHKHSQRTPKKHDDIASIVCELSDGPTKKRAHILQTHHTYNNPPDRFLRAHHRSSAAAPSWPSPRRKAPVPHAMEIRAIVLTYSITTSRCHVSLTTRQCFRLLEQRLAQPARLHLFSNRHHGLPRSHREPSKLRRRRLRPLQQ